MTPDTTPFKQGQEVRHKTGGPTMIVDAVRPHHQTTGYFQVDCSWYAGQHDFKHETFGHDCLIPVSTQPTTATP